MATKTKPFQLTIRAYQVGFGDCFLLTFHYNPDDPKKDRHILIDFGSTAKPKTAPSDLMMIVAESIKKECGGKLHAVVATHRHQDHISGFATRENGTGTGDVIASCNPSVVIQPWTEHPNAQPEATSAPSLASKKSLSSNKSFVASLSAMNEVSESLLAEMKDLKLRLGRSLQDQLSFLGEDNIKNPSAVNNLMQMGRRHVYVHYGSKSGLESILPGVKVRVLGPPDLTQTETIRKMRSKDKDQFWHLQAQAGQFVLNKSKKLFPGAETYSTPPAQSRWLIHRMQALRGDQMLEIVRALDDVMNNTSLILMFETGGKKFLFPGDAQWENWEYALTRPGADALFSDVNLYKVGHHGSLNATPKSLWKLFNNRSDKKSATRLQTVISTVSPNKHGDPRRGTEVPRSKLVDALKAESDYHTTQDVNPKDKQFKDEPYEKLVIDLT